MIPIPEDIIIRWPETVLEEWDHMQETINMFDRQVWFVYFLFYFHDKTNESFVQDI